LDVICADVTALLEQLEPLASPAFPELTEKPVQPERTEQRELAVQPARRARMVRPEPMELLAVQEAAKENP